MDSAGANNNFIEILESHFEFGIRINSPIEIMRFKRFYADDYGMDCSWTDEEIMDKIQQNCFIHEEKGYILEENTVDSILNEIYELKMNGARIILHRMDLKGIEIATGSACDSKDTQISHVLTAIGLSEEYAKGTVRISLGAENTKEEVDVIVTQLIQIVESMNESR